MPFELRSAVRQRSPSDLKLAPAFAFCSMISGKVQRSERLVRGILPNNPLTLISRESCFLDGGKERSDQINGGVTQKKQHSPTDRRWSLTALRLCGHRFPEPIFEEVQRSTAT